MGRYHAYAIDFAQYLQKLTKFVQVDEKILNIKKTPPAGAVVHKNAKYKTWVRKRSYLFQMKIANEDFKFSYILKTTLSLMFDLVQ